MYNIEFIRFGISNKINVSFCFTKRTCICAERLRSEVYFLRCFTIVNVKRLSMQLSHATLEKRLQRKSNLCLSGFISLHLAVLICFKDHYIVSTNETKWSRKILSFIVGNYCNPLWLTESAGFAIAGNLFSMDWSFNFLIFANLS